MQLENSHLLKITSMALDYRKPGRQCQSSFQSEIYIVFVRTGTHPVFIIEPQDRKIFVEQKKQSVSGEKFHRRMFSPETFCGSFYQARRLRFSRLIFPCLKFKDFSSLNFLYGMPNLP